jgi:AraC-like DNA-binding protein
MKVIQFTIPVARVNSVVVQEDILPYFYNHLHRHNETQITWILKGEGTLIVGNYMQPFKAGDIYVLGANQPHIFKCDPAYFDKRRKKEVHGLTFFFNPNGFFKAVLDIPEAKAINQFISSATYGLQLPDSRQKMIAAEMLKVKSAKQGFRLATFIRMLQIMAGIKDWKVLATIPSENSFSDTEGLRMNDIYQFTMSRYSDNIRLQEVADVAHLTPQAFCRYFKKHTRKTYVNFLSEIRISEACKKIIAGDFDSISSVAYDTGFSSAVSFNRVFKKITGKSPKQYLNEYIQKID